MPVPSSCDNAYDHSNTEASSFYVSQSNTSASKNIRRRIETFAIQADHLAHQILAKNGETTYDAGVVISEPYYYTPHFYRPSPSVVIIDNSPGPKICHATTLNKKDKKEDENKHAALIAIVAAVVGAVVIYWLGSSIGAYNDTTNALEETHKFKKKICDFQEKKGDLEDSLIGEAKKTAKLQKRICERTKDSAFKDIILRSGLLGACCAAITGVVMENPMTLHGAGVVATVSMIGMLFKWGLDSTNCANLRDASALRNSVISLKYL